MGNKNNENNKEEEMNFDANIKGDINIYVCGNINTFLDCKDGFNYIASSNYYVLEQIFEKKYNSENGKIMLKENNGMYYQYEFRRKKKDAKIYNAFLFFNKADMEFLDMLFNHLYDIDKTNRNKNVILFFGKNEEIMISLNKLKEKSMETVPILIIINNNNKQYTDKLKYVNYIPDLNTIKDYIKNKKNNNKLTEDELAMLSEKALINFINSKLFRIDLYYNQLGYNLNIINPMDETYLKIKVCVTVALVGCSGCGKSTLINLIFNELISRISPSSMDVTTKCSEYYLPIKETNGENLGQIRFLDFPGINEDKNYEKVVEPEIKNKIVEYKQNMEQIDIALFFISNGNERELKSNLLKLINLLHENKIKIIFVINGDMKPDLFEFKKKGLKTTIENADILYDDFSNVIHTNFYQYFNKTDKTGITLIFQKIIEEIKIKDEKFKIEDINIENFNKQLIHLSKYCRTFEQYESMNAIKEKAKIKANLVVAGYSLLSCGSSALSLVVPLVDNVLAVGYQVAMVYNIFNIYEIKPKDYNIIKIILTGGDAIEEKQRIPIPDNNGDNKATKGVIEEIAKGSLNTGKFAGQCAIQTAGVKEAGKVVIEKTVETVVTDTVKGAGIKITTNTMEGIVVNAVEQTVTNTFEKIAVESAKELAETGLKEGSKVIVDVAKGAVIAAAEEGGEQFLVVGTKESVKTVTETIIFQQGGKGWLINLGKSVP